jgi:hypothetical protein
MKKISLLLCMLASVSLSLSRQKFGKIITDGYSAEIIRIEYLPDSMARVYVAYALFPYNNEKYTASIKIYEEVDNGFVRKQYTIKGGASALTGFVTFSVKQKQKVILLYETEVNYSSYLERFSLNTLKK